MSARRITSSAVGSAPTLGPASDAAYAAALADIPKGLRVETVFVDVEPMYEVGNPQPVGFDVEVTVEAVRDL